MNARALMTPAPTCVGPDDLISDVAALMLSQDIGVLPVIETSDGNKLIGMITDRDIVLRCTAKNHPPDECCVHQHMSTDAIASVAPTASVDEIAEIMERFQVRRVPVVDTAGHVVGIVGQADLTRVVGQEQPELIEEVLENVLRPSSVV